MALTNPLTLKYCFFLCKSSSLNLLWHAIKDKLIPFPILQCPITVSVVCKLSSRLSPRVSTHLGLLCCQRGQVYLKADIKNTTNLVSSVYDLMKRGTKTSLSVFLTRWHKDLVSLRNMNHWSCGFLPCITVTILCVVIISHPSLLQSVRKRGSYQSKLVNFCLLKNFCSPIHLLFWLCTLPQYSCF